MIYHLSCFKAVQIERKLARGSSVQHHKMIETRKRKQHHKQIAVLRELKCLIILTIDFSNSTRGYHHLEGTTCLSNDS